MKRMIIACLVIAGLSCGKDDTTEPWSFNWTHQAVLHKGIAADAYASPYNLYGPNEIVATDLSGPPVNYRIDIQLFSLSPNSYSIGGANSFDYVDDLGFNLIAVQGSVTISSNSNNKLSGTFSVTLNNSSTVTGSFNKINLRP